MARIRFQMPHLNHLRAAAEEGICLNKCEIHKDCESPAVAKVGLPSKDAVWVCLRGFDDYQEGKLTLPKNKV